MSSAGSISAVRLQLGPDMALPSGEALIKAFEDCKLRAYQDQRGVWTIGWGHTGPGIVSGLIWTQAQADTQFDADFAARNAGFDQLDLALTPGQKSACQSLIYNVGLQAFETSHLLVCIRARDWIGAAKEFSRWDHVGASEAAGLLHRRLAEALVFLAGSRG